MTRFHSAPSRRHMLSAAVIAVLSFAIPLQSLAADGDTPAETIVTDLVDGMWQTLTQADISEAERIDGVAEKIEAGTDTQLLGRLVLGNAWRQLSEDEQQRYLKSFPGFITTTLAGQIVAASEGVSGDLSQHFMLIGSEEAGDRDTVVQTEITTPQAEALRVDWRFRDRDGQLTLIDVLIDGVSLLITKRNEFGSIIERQSVEELLTELERVGGETAG